MAIPFAMIELDKPRKMRLTLMAMIEYEQLTGEKIADVNDETSIEHLAKLLWIIMKQEDENLTFKQSCALIDDYSAGITSVYDAITRTLMASTDTGEVKNVRPAVRKK